MRTPLLLLAAACATAPRPAKESPRLGPLLEEAIRFPTVAGNDQARRDQQAWLLRTAASLGLVARDAGPVTEVELPGPAGAPVLGLVVHGDVQPVDEKQWTVPPFAGESKAGVVYGRGAADDKGPLVQALLAMHAIRDLPRNQTVRLLVGSDEESGSSDMGIYLQGHAPPAYTLVLDSEFPGVVGEKAWDGLAVLPSDLDGGKGKPWSIGEVSAGLAPSIVPDIARVTLRWNGSAPSWDALERRLRARTPDPGTRLELRRHGNLLDVIVHGRSAHAGVNLAGGRNALVSLARLTAAELPDCALADLLAFAAHAGEDLHGATLGLPAHAEPGWRGWDVNVATLGPSERLQGKLALVINLRRPPPLSGAQSRDLLFAQVRQFSPRLVPADFYFRDEPLVFNRDAKLVRRLMDDYAHATGERPPPAISGGGTYAKRLPNAIAFGMWFPGKPYPGHDVDEQISLADLSRGLDVLVETLRDLVSNPPLQDPLQP
ncbi:MAG TPA: M20/M25/M40 family metallo-hydrolase [Myxococcales bacterium]|nr:M20/M25/M40 family metallo-hydrolase [Myxococcales bacterium]